MTNKELVAKLHDIVNNYKTVYAYGVFGSIITESLLTQKAKQYPAFYTAAKMAELRKLIGKGVWGFDCVNVIKGLLWGWSGNTSKTYGGGTYASNGVPDIDANAMINLSKGVSTDFTKIKFGSAVWCQGHIGVYIGDGKAIECTPSWKNNVQITAVANIGAISGLPSRKWTKHGCIPYITYEDAGSSTVTPTPPSSTGTTSTPGTTISVGATVTFKGGPVFPSSTDAKSSGTRGKSICKVTTAATGKVHPYHLVSVDTAGVYGWVNAADIESGAGAAVTVGRKVKITGDRYSTGETVPATIKAATHIVSAIDANGTKAHLGASGGINSWVNLKDLQVV